MTPHIFFIFTALAFIAAAVAFLPIFRRQVWLFSESNKNSSPNKCHRKYLLGGALFSMVPIVTKMTFAIFPLLEARWMPIAIYAPIQREFWLPFSVLFFAIVSHLVPVRNRKSILLIVVVLFVVVIHHLFWHLTKPDIYNFEGKIVGGVCHQTSYETCGPASMVTMLKAMGIQTTEGEMARLSMTAPQKGLSPHQAGIGLKRKLAQLDRSENVTVRAPEFKDLQNLRKPFLAGIRFSSSTNHMICVLETTRDSLIVGDPISFGPKNWSWEHFRENWSGIIVACQ